MNKPTAQAAGPFLRRGAAAGDVLFAVGAAPESAGRGGQGGESSFSGLGLARLGLKELEARGRAALADYPAACAALLAPRPQLAAGRMLAGLLRHGRLHCMDVSDGLARDLPRLLAAGNSRATPAPGADLEFAHEDLHPEIRRRYSEKEALAETLSGGDDYCLLCACPPEIFTLAQEALKGLKVSSHLQILGKISSLPGIRWHGRPVDDMFGARAFDHFG